MIVRSFTDISNSDPLSSNVCQEGDAMIISCLTPWSNAYYKFGGNSTACLSLVFRKLDTSPK